MNRNEKTKIMAKIKKFYHPKTIKLVIGKVKKGKMLDLKLGTLHAVATGQLPHDQEPGSWIIQMDQMHKDGRS